MHTRARTHARTHTFYCICLVTMYIMYIFDDRRIMRMLTLTLSVAWLAARGCQALTATEQAYFTIKGVTITTSGTDYKFFSTLWHTQSRYRQFSDELQPEFHTSSGLQALHSPNTGKTVDTNVSSQGNHCHGCQRSGTI